MGKVVDDYSAGWNMEDASYLFNDEERTTKEKIKDYCVNDGVKLVFIILYILGNIALFLDSYLKYVLADPNNPTTTTFLAYQALGQGVAIARGAANALKLNCSFILIPVLRNMLSFLRGTWVNNYLPIDKNIVFHKYIGYVIFILVLIHAEAHYTNYWKVSQFDHGLPLPGALNKITANPPTVLAFTTLPGATGHGAFLCLCIMYSAAIERVRRWYFEVFWYSHHLFIPFFALLLAHGTAAQLEPAQFWMWFLGPAILYLLERLIRVGRGSIQTIVHQAIQHPSNVIEIRLKRRDGKPFHYKSGQYCFLNSPYLAYSEWHPFTITSTPNGDPYLSFHIKGGKKKKKRKKKKKKKKKLNFCFVQRETGPRD
jgi:NADPH oxidase